jgi:hypothetical protein
MLPNSVKIMNIFDITNFKDTTLYKHVRFSQKAMAEKSDEDIALFVLKTQYKEWQQKCITIQDSHTFSDIHDINGRRVIPFHTKDTPQKYTGIYDIWLRNCENIRKVAVGTSDFLIPIENFVQNEKGDIQIPLAIPGEGAPIQQIFTKREGNSKNTLSFIPTIALELEGLCVYINHGGSCTVSISTVYCTDTYHRHVCHSKNTFYVNGTEVVCKHGCITRPRTSTEDHKCVVM